MKYKPCLILILICFLSFYSYAGEAQHNRGRPHAGVALTKNMEIGKLKVEFDVKACVLLSLVIITILYLLYRATRSLGEITAKNNELITQKNKQLEQLVAEKDWLIKEVHHRVKNNLQTVMSLLASQASYLKDEQLTAIENSQHRIYAMSLIHKKLYQSEDVKTIEMDKFLIEFVQYLRESFGGSNQIYFKYDLETIQLGVTQAIPLALVVNEAITNSLKYAFPHDTPGKISISIKKIDGLIKLTLGDNGIGMPDLRDDADLATFGIALMKGLCKEIHGKIEFSNKRGTEITMTFLPSIVFDYHLISPEASPI